jgi:hypothetical protein
MSLGQLTILVFMKMESTNNMDIGSGSAAKTSLWYGIFALYWLYWLKMPCFGPASANWSQKGPNFTRTSLSEFFLSVEKYVFPLLAFLSQLKSLMVSRGLLEPKKAFF